MTRTMLYLLNSGVELKFKQNPGAKDYIYKLFAADKKHWVSVPLRAGQLSDTSEVELACQLIRKKLEDMYKMKRE